MTKASNINGVLPNGAPVGTIAFSSLAPRGWDLYISDVQTQESRRLTDHPALDYNAVFSSNGQNIAFVSERNGNPELFTIRADGSDLRRLTKVFALNDHPAFSPDGRHIAFVSTRQPAALPGQAWNAVYVIHADGSGVKRLSPANAADFSPAWSPKGDLIAFASGSGKSGNTDLFVMRPDGSGRRLVVNNGGWPSFAADGQSLFFHSQRQGGRWSVWRVNLDGTNPQRITPPDFDAFTPMTSLDGKMLVLTRLRGERRQIEVMELSTGKLTPLTMEATDHWNPSISPDGRQVVYHRVTPGLVIPNVERWGAPPGTDLELLRLAGAFPAFSPDGKRLALVGDLSRLDHMKTDGSGRKTIFAGQPRGLFSTTWAHQDERIAFAVGGVFAGAGAEVDLMTVRPDGSGLRQLTRQTGNNGFPSFSPDGKQLVFRSGRRSNKNLYLLNSDGTGLRQLTQGEWTDTMCDWSRKGDWIVFASDRDGDFDIWLIRPDGSGLHKLIGGGGLNNHPNFSPDSQWVVFTSQRAGYSAEEVSLPFQFQPYGDLFAIRIDGTDLLRLTHNGFEEGTPAWGP